MGTPHVRRTKSARPAFTLVELLVVMAIIIILATLAVAFAPKFRDQQKPATAASDIQNALTMAKQWALRDKAPRGLRFANAFNPTTGMWQIVPPLNSPDPAIMYIEQPDDFGGQGGGSIYYPAPSPPAGPPPGFVIGGFATGTVIVDFTGGIANPNFWPVQTNDYLELVGNTTQVFRIAGVLNGQNLLLANDKVTPPPPALPPPIDVEGATLTSFAGTAWRVIRQARPRQGEAAINLPKNIVVDFSVNNQKSPWTIADYATGLFPPSYYSYPPAATVPAGSSTGHFDILFDATGKVIGPGSSGRDIKLWVRDASLDPVVAGQPRFKGEQYIVSVATRTGLISIQAVDVTPDATGVYYAQPYYFTRDGRSSGQ